jgi:Gpi18-like mannosyltransferase
MKNIKNNKYKPFFMISALWGIWRISLFIIASIGEKLLPFTPRFPYADVYLLPSRLPSWIWSFANFDGVHYLGIAQKGYWAQYTQVFFPVFPFILRLFSYVLPFLNPVLIGIVLSSVFFLFSLFGLYKLLLLDYKEPDIYWIIIYIIVFPASFYWGSLYTEGLFLLLFVLSLHFARHKRWVLSGICGGIASATKLIGIFLLPALLWEWQKSRQKKQFSHTSLFSYFKSPIIYLVPLGLMSYMIYLQYYFGDAFYFWHAQPVFGAQRSGSSIILLPQVIYRYIKIVCTNSYYTEAFWIPLFELISTIGAIVLLIIAHKLKIRKSLLIFSWFTVLVPTLTGTLSSMPRYILVVLPMYMVLAKIKNNWIKKLIILLFIILSSILTVLFTKGHWVA